MWEKFSVVVALAFVAEWLLRPIQTRWRKMRISQTVAALNRGDAARVRCAARFHNSGGSRHRARLAFNAAGVLLSATDGAIAQLELGNSLTPDNVEAVVERSMLVCNVDGRQLEILLPSGEDRLLEAVLARLLKDSNAAPTTTAVTPQTLSAPTPAHHTS
ncbi:hypothetical protein ACWCPD_41035 [Streptomyces sp. NPDC001935]